MCCRAVRSGGRGHHGIIRVGKHLQVQPLTDTPMSSEPHHSLCSLSVTPPPPWAAWATLSGQKFLLMSSLSSHNQTGTSFTLLCFSASHFFLFSLLLVCFETFPSDPGCTPCPAQAELPPLSAPRLKSCLEVSGVGGQSLAFLRAESLIPIPHLASLLGFL